MTTLITLLVLLALAAVAYWLLQAHHAAQHARWLSAPRVQVPDAATQSLLAQRLAQFDASDDRELPLLLRRQAQ